MALTAARLQSTKAPSREPSQGSELRKCLDLASYNYDMVARWPEALRTAAASTNESLVTGRGGLS